MNIHEKIKNDFAKRQEKMTTGEDDNVRFKREVAEGIGMIAQGQYKVAMAAKNPAQEKMANMLLENSTPALAVGFKNKVKSGLNKIAKGEEELALAPENLEQEKQLVQIKELKLRNDGIILNEMKKLGAGASMGAGN